VDFPITGWKYQACCFRCFFSPLAGEAEMKIFSRKGAKEEKVFPGRANLCL
jgi:hypothetical protein